VPLLGSIASTLISPSPNAECVCKCAEKYIKLTQRVGFRFAEHQAIQGAKDP